LRELKIWVIFELEILYFLIQKLKNLVYLSIGSLYDNKLKLFKNGTDFSNILQASNKKLRYLNIPMQHDT